MDNPRVSIIIPTFNAENNIRTCLQSVAKQNYRNTEVIVVDNCSKDKTVKVAREYKCEVFVERSTWAEAVNSGIERSVGKYYFVMESSLEIFPSFIGECVAKAEEDSGIVGLLGPEFSQGDGFWANCMKLERLLNIGYEVVEAPRFVRRSAYDLIGSYDTSLEFGVDWEFFVRLRKVGMVSRVGVGWIHHEGHPTPYSMMKKKYRYGRTARRYLSKVLITGNPSGSLLQFIPIRPNFIRKPHLLRKVGLRVVLGYLLLKTVEMMAVETAVVSSAVEEALGNEILYGHMLSE